MSNKIDTESGMLATLPGLVIGYALIKGLGPLPGFAVLVAGIGINFLVARTFGKSAIIPVWLAIIAGSIAWIAFTTGNMPTTMGQP